MKIYVLAFLFPLLGLSASARQIDPAILSACNTAKDIAYLSAEEKEVVLYLNMARAYPETFLRYYLKEAGAQLKQNKTEAYHALERELHSAKALPLLIPDEELSQIAKNQASDMGKTGKTGHTSSKGKSFRDRTLQFKKEKGENCDYGHAEALLIVADLLIDDKVPGYGHRKNSLNPRFLKVGVSIQPHSRYQFNCVMDFTE